MDIQGWGLGEGTGTRGRERVWEVQFGSPPSSVSEGEGCTFGNSGVVFRGRGLALGAERGFGEFGLGVLHHL